MMLSRSHISFGTNLTKEKRVPLSLGHPLYGVVWCCVVELTVSFSEVGFCLGGDVVSAMLVVWVSGGGMGNRR